MPSLWGCVDSFRVQPEKAWITIDFVGCGYKHLCERLIRDIKNESGKEGKSRMRKAIRLLCYGKELAFMAFLRRSERFFGRARRNTGISGLSGSAEMMRAIMGTGSIIISGRNILRFRPIM